MKAFGGWQFPDGETHLIDWMAKVNDRSGGRLRYQGKKQDEAMKCCNQFRTAVDIGSHIGLWSYYLNTRFQQVHAFEPVAAHRECFNQNVVGPVLYPVALGEKAGSVSIHTAPTSSGDSWVDGDGEIPMHTLDSYDLVDVDFIKVDNEGYELFALKGGEETIKRCHPCIIVEQKPGRAQKFGLKETEAVDYLISLGAKLRKVMSGDYILSWD